MGTLTDLGSEASGGGFRPGGSLARLLGWRLAERPAFPFLWVEEEGPWTIRQLAAEAVRIQQELEDCSVGPGSLVLIRLGNDQRFLPSLMATWGLGATAVTMHPAAPAAEVARVVETMVPVAVVAAVTDDALGAITLPVVRVEAGPADGGEGVGTEPFTPPDEDRVPGRAPALVLLTSGSSGAPKGVVLSHDNAWANLAATVSAFRSKAGPTPLSDRRRPPNLIANPLSHSGGVVRLLLGLYVGRGIVMLRKFDAIAALRAVRRHGIDNLTINPTMLRMLLEDLPADASLDPVRYVSSGTAPLPEALRLRFEDRFGVPVLQSYGQTETFGAVAIENARDVLGGRRRPGSVGRVLPAIELRILGEDGEEVPVGTPGEICVISPASTQRYLGTDAVPVGEDGWLHTGDLGRLDADGYLFIVGRKRDIIICGGFNIVPEELEAALAVDEAVRAAAVFGLPDERLGEIPVALVESDDDAEAVLRRVGGVVSAYKRPRKLFVVDHIPRLPNGKVDKVSSQAMAAALVIA
ncbi:MAG TPA: class I adenylate-forming enzyme family protein [Acidimicrobiales bacterium]|nr:class I adenylate-forming enzyme family protein [Acidimicrobiales bacterium]